MDLNGFDHPGRPAAGGTRSVKVMIAGGFGTGKTTMVRSVSDIKPLTTEETLTQASADVDHLIGVADKTETTVSLDFGKISLNDSLMLYLFGTPGQERFWFLWNGLFKERSARWSSSTPGDWPPASGRSRRWSGRTSRSSSR